MPGRHRVVAQFAFALKGRGFTDCGKTVLFALYCSPRAAIGTDLLLVAG
jgi:hypothetical protein